MERESIGLKFRGRTNLVVIEKKKGNERISEEIQ